MKANNSTTTSYDANAQRWADRMRRKENLAHTYLEKPAMRKTLPSLRGKSVLCLGCGSGEEIAMLQRKGARHIVGIDLSTGLIARARATYPTLEFHVMNMQDLRFPANSFDLVYSSLAMHYLRKWTPLLRRVGRILTPDGVFLFSTHHPIVWGAQRVRRNGKRSFLLGCTPDRKKIFGDYLKARQLHDVLGGQVRVQFFHKPFSEMLREIRQSGLEIVDCIEPTPIPSVRRRDHVFWSLYRRIPLFIIFKLRKLSSLPGM